MEKSNIKDICKVFLLAFFLPQLVGFCAVLFFMPFFEDTNALQNSYLYIFTMSLLAQACFFVIYYFYSKKNKVAFKTEIKSIKNKASLNNILLCVLISVIAVFGLVYFVQIFDIIFSKIGYKPSDLALPLNTFGWFLVNVLISAVTPAIMEELIFRKIIFKGLRRKGFWFSAIISSVMFMLVHQNLGSTAYPIIMGIIFCLVVEKTGSVFYSMVIHFGNNFIVLLINFIQNISRKPIFIELNFWWQYSIAIIVALLAVFVIYLIIQKMLDKKCEVIEIKESTKDEENELLITAEKIEEEKLEKKAEARTIIYTLIISAVFWIILVATSLL